MASMALLPMMKAFYTNCDAFIDFLARPNFQSKLSKSEIDGIYITIYPNKLTGFNFPNRIGEAKTRKPTNLPERLPGTELRDATNVNIPE